jgi:hypothetical protein
MRPKTWAGQEGCAGRAGDTPSLRAGARDVIGEFDGGLLEDRPHPEHSKPSARVPVTRDLVSGRCFVLPSFRLPSSRFRT